MVRGRVVVIFAIVIFGVGKFCESKPNCPKNANLCKKHDEQSLRFYILGDMGGEDNYPYTSSIQTEIAKTIDQDSTQTYPHFFMTTGDNFYENGVHNVTDPRFNETFDDVYQYGKDRDLPWFITAGNHDNYGNVQAQVEYSQVNRRWIFPSTYYSFQYYFGPSSAQVQFFVLDTWMLCGDPVDGKYGPFDEAAANESLAWLEFGLQTSKADYIFLVGHYALYSTGHHGGDSYLVKDIQNLLIKYKVNGYIAGHNHHLEHLIMNSTTWPVHLISSGAASKVDKPKSPPKVEPMPVDVDVISLFTFPQADDSDQMGGYVYAELNADQARFDYYRSDKKLLYSFSTDKRNA
jgi:tartrate-resistant acid phosphatase type 5